LLRFIFKYNFLVQYFFFEDLKDRIQNIIKDFIGNWYEKNFLEKSNENLFIFFENEKNNLNFSNNESNQNDKSNCDDKSDYDDKNDYNNKSDCENENDCENESKIKMNECESKLFCKCFI
jgi:hypothetical protein